MLGKCQSTFPQQISPVYDRMHEQIVTYPEMTDIIPGKNDILRKCAFIINNNLAVLAFLVIYVIGNKHIDLIIGIRMLFQCFYHFCV